MEKKYIYSYRNYFGVPKKMTEEEILNHIEKMTELGAGLNKEEYKIFELVPVKIVYTKPTLVRE